MITKPYYTHNGFTARESTPADADSIAAIFNFYVSMGGITYVDKRVHSKLFYEKLKKSCLCVAVLEKDDKVIAWTSWQQLYSFSNVALVTGYIHPDYINNGILTKHWEYADEVAKYFGWDSYVVNIASTNTISLEIHQRFGFEIVGTIKNVRVGKGKKFDQVWLQRDIE